MLEERRKRFLKALSQAHCSTSFFMIFHSADLSNFARIPKETKVEQKS